MRLFFGSVAPLTLMTLGIGCNTVSPDECWPNTSGGLGGGGPIPIGAGVGASSGDFLSPPPRGPLDYGGAANPCIEKQSSCNEKCLADYEAAAIECGKVGDATQRKTCQDDAYAAYKSCGAGCQQSNDCKEACKEKCDRAWERCRDNCPKGDKNCLNECSQEYGTCLKDCDQRCK
jgi:hypothetical protein